MATTRRAGWVDSFTDSRLTWVTGTTYPAPPASVYLALCRGVPLADGSDSAGLEVVRVGPVTYGAPQTPSGAYAGPVYRAIQPTAPVSVTPPGTPGTGAIAYFAAFGLMTVSNGGTPVYIGTCDISLPVGVATSLPASAFSVAAEASQG